MHLFIRTGLNTALPLVAVLPPIQWSGAMAEPLSDGMWPDGFAMLAIAGADAPLLTALRERRLQPRDGTTLLALVQHLEWRSGRVYATPAQLAAAARFEIGQMHHSLRRLRLQGFLAKGIDRKSGRPFWCFSPALVATRGRRCRERQWAQFMEAME